MEVERAQNGGFPEPLAGEPVRMVRCRHAACGTATRVRVPQALPARAVRRVVCEGCSQTFECDGPDDGGVVAAAATPAGGGWSQGRAWKYLSLPLAAAAVIGVLILVQGNGGDSGDRSESASRPPAAPADNSEEAQPPATAPKSGGGAELVRGSSYTLALPDGWARTEPQNGATFSAAAQGGGAEATLWVRRDPSMSFPQFESQSLAQLRDATGSDATVVDRTTAPTADGTIVTLAADSPSGAPQYEVTLRAGGPYRYYLATTVEPDASKTAADGAELIRSSFVPVATGKSG
jgi:hypothetical protein